LTSKNPALVKVTGFFVFWWRGMDLNHGPSGYAYHYSFRCLIHRNKSFVGLDCPFTLVVNVRVSAFQSLHLPKVSLSAWLGIIVLATSPNLTDKHIDVSTYAALPNLAVKHLAKLNL
jgi:hypothetical protein